MEFKSQKFPPFTHQTIGRLLHLFVEYSDPKNNVWYQRPLTIMEANMGNWWHNEVVGYPLLNQPKILEILELEDCDLY